MTTVNHGFDLKAIQGGLQLSGWEDDPNDDARQTRRIYLGSFQALTPSGKLYTLWACSNVMGCNTCKGSGRLVPRKYKRRAIKKHRSRHARITRAFDRLNGDSPGIPSLKAPFRPTNKRAAFSYIDRQPKRYRMRYLAIGSMCQACGGSGSRDAHLDELWHEACQLAFGSIGVSFESDSGDYFALEYRDMPDPDGE